MSYPQEKTGHRISSTEPAQYAVVEVDEDDDVPEVSQHFSAFEDKSRRMAFVRKTLGTVLLQLLVCAAITGACVLLSSPETKLWMYKHWYIGLIGSVFWIMICIAVGCCNVGRGPPGPLNIAILIFGTLCLSTLCAFMTVAYSQDVIIYSLASTVLILLIIVIITVFTPIDITGWGIFLLCAGLALFIGSIMAGLFLALSGADRKTMTYVTLALSVLFIILLTLYILYDLQLIVGGRKHQLGEDDWLFACLMLFGDIVYLFMQLLQCFGILPQT